MISVTLPLPPSANRLWRVSRGVAHKSTEYRDWLALAARHLQDAGYDGRQIDGPYCLHLYIPASGRGDIDNRIKAASDLIAKSGLTPDDRHMQVVYVRRDEHVAAGTCRILVFEVSKLQANAPGVRWPEALPAPCRPSAGSVEAAPS